MVPSGFVVGTRSIVGEAMARLKQRGELVMRCRTKVVAVSSRGELHFWQVGEDVRLAVRFKNQEVRDAHAAKLSGWSPECIHRKTSLTCSCVPDEIRERTDEAFGALGTELKSLHTTPELNELLGMAPSEVVNAA